MKRHVSLPGLILSAMLVSTAIQAVEPPAESGVLDRPLPMADSVPAASTAAVATMVETVESTQTVIDPQALKEELDREVVELEQLNAPALEEKARQGQRAAQLVLAENFAKEAEMLAFAPTAANEALSDAVRWYSLAASRGFPGSPPLDKAGVRFYPIRVQRSR